MHMKSMQTSISRPSILTLFMFSMFTRGSLGKTKRLQKTTSGYSLKIQGFFFFSSLQCLFEKLLIQFVHAHFHSLSLSTILSVCYKIHEMIQVKHIMENSCFLQPVVNWNGEVEYTIPVFSSLEEHIYQICHGVHVRLYLNSSFFLISADWEELLEY